MKLSDDARTLRECLAAHGTRYTDIFDSLSIDQIEHAAELVSIMNVGYAAAGFIAYYGDAS